MAGGDPGALPSTWFVLIGAVWTLYLVLGGADLGVGMLLRRRAADGGPLRDVALRAIGPTWAANDVWLVIAVASMLGAFPGWYAAWTSGLYLPLVVLLLALIVRHAGIELLAHASPREQARWASAIVASSYVLALGWGIAWAAAVDGSLAARGAAGLAVLSPATLAVGLALVALCRLQGVAFLRLRAPRAAAGLDLGTSALAAVVLVLGAAVALAWGAVPGVGIGAAGLVAAALAVVASAGLAVAVRRGLPGPTFLAASLLSAAAFCTLLAALFPAAIAGPGPGAIGVAGEASGDLTLTIMLGVAAVLLPLLLGALGYAYARFLRAPVPAEGEAPRGGLGGLVARAARGTLEELR